MDYRSSLLRLGNILTPVSRPMGIVAGMVTQLNQPAAEIVQNMAREAYELLQSSGRQSSQPKL